MRSESTLHVAAIVAAVPLEDAAVSVDGHSALVVPAHSVLVVLVNEARVGLGTDNRTT